MHRHLGNRIHQRVSEQAEPSTARGRAADPEAKVVMVSALDQKSKLSECIRLGALDFIVKPFDRERLLGLLCVLLVQTRQCQTVCIPQLCLQFRIGGRRQRADEERQSRIAVTRQRFLNEVHAMLPGQAERTLADDVALDLVGAAVFLSSRASDFVNGHVLYVDGGVTATL